MSVALSFVLSIALALVVTATGLVFAHKKRYGGKFVCLHDWECVGDVMSPGYSGQFKCRKCGKEEGL